ncbi:MAG: putative peptidoglycan glycosyltransferase FtsW [Anaerolineales bacterium]|jgi:cell division protein FtsW
MGIGTFVDRTSRPSSATHVRGQRAGGDLILIAAVIALVIFGLLMLYSASTDFSLQVYGSSMYMFDKQLVWLAIGGGIAILLSRIDYHIWRRFAVLLMGLTILLLVGVLINSEVRFGAVRTFIGGSAQPSELAKLAIVIYLSVWLYSKREQLHDIQLGMIPLAMILGLVCGLTYLEPDLSTTLMILFIGGLLFFLAGGDLRQIVLFLVVAFLVGWVVIQISATGRQRMASYLAGLKDPVQANYQILRSLGSIVNGGWFGVGIGQASTKLTGLPFAATDSIFAVIVEELGLFGAAALIGLYGLLLWRGLKVALQAPDSLGSVMAAGLTFWIIAEAFMNMGVMVGLLPPAGNALPFISAGGSNLISTLAGIGILVNISRQGGQGHPGGHPAPEGEERRSYSASVDLRRRDRRRRESRSRRA